MMLGMVSDWIRKHWRKGDFKVVPLVSQNATVGRITQLTGANEPIPSIPCKVPVRPIAEKIKSLQAQAARKRRKAPVASKPKRRSKGQP